MCRTACTEPQCLYSTAIPLLPLWAVQSVQTLSALYSTAIPLLPLWAIQPVQSLSACTVQLYLYSPYVPYGLYRTSVPIQYSYNSTPPMGRTACTEPQCLYNSPLVPFMCIYIYIYHYFFSCLLHLKNFRPFYFHFNVNCKCCPFFKTSGTRLIIIL